MAACNLKFSSKFSPVPTPKGSIFAVLRNDVKIWFLAFFEACIFVLKKRILRNRSDGATINMGIWFGWLLSLYFHALSISNHFFSSFVQLPNIHHCWKASWRISPLLQMTTEKMVRNKSQYISFNQWNYTKSVQNAQNLHSFVRYRHNDIFLWLTVHLIENHLIKLW